MKHKHQKLIRIGSINIVHDGKLNMLDDMIVMVDDIIDDIPYIRRYYPLDDALRNKGSLTLVSPKFVMEFSSLLKLIDLTLEPCINDDKIAIPDKKMVIEQMKETFVTEKRNLVNVICETSKMISSKRTLDHSDRVSLVWEIIERVLNASIGGLVKQYRQLKLTRVNDVSFRKRIAVKCETKNV